MSTKAIEKQDGSTPPAPLDQKKLGVLIRKAHSDAKAAAEFWEMLEDNGTADTLVCGSDVAYTAELVSVFP